MEAIALYLEVPAERDTWQIVAVDEEATKAVPGAYRVLSLMRAFDIGWSGLIFELEEGRRCLLAFDYSYIVEVTGDKLRRVWIDNAEEAANG